MLQDFVNMNKLFKISREPRRVVKQYALKPWRGLFFRKAEKPLQARPICHRLARNSRIRKNQFIWDIAAQPSGCLTAPGQLVQQRSLIL